MEVKWQGAFLYEDDTETFHDAEPRGFHSSRLRKLMSQRWHRCSASASLEENNIANCRGVASRVQLRVHSSATVIMTDLGKYFSWQTKLNGCIITSELRPLKPDHMRAARSCKDTSRSAVCSSRPWNWNHYLNWEKVPWRRESETAAN